MGPAHSRGEDADCRLGPPPGSAGARDLSMPTSQQLDLLHGGLGSPGGCPKRPERKLPGLFDLERLLPSLTGAARHLSRFKGRRKDPPSPWLEVRESVGMFVKRSGEKPVKGDPGA